MQGLKSLALSFFHAPQWRACAIGNVGGADLRFVDYNIAASDGNGAPVPGWTPFSLKASAPAVNGVTEPVDLVAMEEIQSQAPPPARTLPTS